MTKRHRGRHAGFARVNLPAEFGSKPAEVEDIDRQSHFLKYRLGNFHQPPGFRHFAGTSLVAT
jgi:hypothetical protein